MNNRIANDLIRYAELVEDGALISPEEMNCASVMRLAAEYLVQPEHLEPVAWIYEDELPESYPYDAMFENSRVIDGVRMFPVNVAPQRTWVGLTDEEMNNFVKAVWPREATAKDYIRAIEAKLKAKNERKEKNT